MEEMRLGQIIEGERTKRKTGQSPGRPLEFLEKCSRLSFERGGKDGAKDGENLTLSHLPGERGRGLDCCPALLWVARARHCLSRA